MPGAEPEIVPLGGAGSGSASAEAGVHGMAAAGASDPAYQQAYRDCMRRRGF